MRAEKGRQLRTDPRTKKITGAILPILGTTEAELVAEVHEAPGFLGNDGLELHISITGVARTFALSPLSALTLRTLLARFEP